MGRTRRALLPVALLAIFAAAALAAVAPHPAYAVIRLGTPNTASLTNGLVGYWPLDGAVTNWATGQTRDLSGNGNTGLLISLATTTASVAGKIGQGLVFDGTISSINVSSLDSTAGSYTYSFWVKSSNAINAGYLFNSSTPRLIMAFVTSSGASGKIGYYDGTWHDLDDAPADGKWHHLVFIMDANTGTGSYYKDGVFVTSSGYTTLNIGGTNAIGSRFNQGTYYFNGTLDDVRVYS